MGTTEHKEASLRALRLEDLWALLRQNGRLMALTAAVMVIAMLTVGFLTPARYQATATLYILRQQEGQAQSPEDFSLALKVVNDCTYLLKSHAVLDPVIQELGLETDYQALHDRVSTSNPEGTRILSITAQGESPEEAKAIVDAICIIGMENIRAVMDYDQVSLYEYGIAGQNPCNRPSALTCLLAGAAGAAVVYGLFLLQFLLDDRLRSQEDVEALGIPFLGEVTGPGGGASRESWQSLRAELLFCGRDARCIAIVSCRKGDGRTTTALQLGLGLAALGKQVLVIRGDLRRGTGSQGLSQILDGTAALEDCLRKTRHPGLAVLSPGKAGEHPAELLGGDKFPALLEEARQTFDYVFIDTPPLDRVIDGAVAASCCDGAVLVIRRDGSSRPQVLRCIARLKRANCRLLGGVLTHAPEPVAGGRGKR